MQDVVTKFEQYKEAFRVLAPNASLGLIKASFLRDYLTNRNTVGSMEVAETIGKFFGPDTDESMFRLRCFLADERQYGARDLKQYEKMLNARMVDILTLAGWDYSDAHRCVNDMAEVLMKMGVALSKDKRNKKCEQAIQNYLTVHVTPGGAVGLSPLHQEIEALGYTRQDVQLAIYWLQTDGHISIEHGAVTLCVAEEARRPTSIAEWQKRVFDLNVSKGWYDKSGLSEKASAILARLPADDVSELLQHMPHADGKRLAQSQEDVATFDANLNGEIAELWEAFRAGTLDKPCDKSDAMRAAGLPTLTCKEEEMADIAIRLFDQAEFWGVDLDRVMWIKHLYNATRAHRHGGKLA